MALNGQAPKIFKKTTKRGVPWAAVLFTLAFGCLGFLNVSNSGATVFQWFSNISTISGFIAWIVVMITYLRFRKAMQYNQMLDALPYKTPLQPYATWFILFLVILLTLTNGFYVFFPSQWSVSSFLAAYITLPIFIALYLGHKIVTATMSVTNGHASRGGPAAKSWFSHWQLARSVEEIDVHTGKREMDELESIDVERVPRNWLEKAWFWLA